ncbi:MAG: hypothetical protein LBC74_02820 [Planctomycetaceae bacterium]|jgi:hypothetical protein|nr:hypothetical protein [Planctomycetaceae bacterium]
MIQIETVFCETKTIDLSNEDVITMYMSPFDVDNPIEEPDEGLMIGDKFSMFVTAAVNDPKIMAEIKDNTLEWRLKSITFYYYVPNEDMTDRVLVKEATYTDSNTLKNSENHPIVVKRPIGQWGKCARWEIVKSPDPNDESSTFYCAGSWEMQFEVEFRGQHKDINDCMIQARYDKDRRPIDLNYYLGMIVVIMPWKELMML